MSETKTREPQFALPDDLPEDQLPEPAAQAEADERDRQRRLEWAIIIQALSDNAMAVTQAMRRSKATAQG
jgi:hypothetical protein